MSERKRIYLCLAHNIFGSRLMDSRLMVMEGKKTYTKKTYKASDKTECKPKRGKLAPLMKEEEKEKASIHELSYDFACRITRLYQYLTEDAEYKEYV